MILLGLRNPYPGEALYPDPVGCAGWRLWQMTGLSREAYLSIDRRNLDDLDLPLKGGDTVVLLGDEVRRAFRLPKLFLHPIVRDGVTYRQVPHPSGRCLFYNDPINQEIVGMLIRCLTGQRRTATSPRAPHSRRL